MSADPIPKAALTLEERAARKLVRRAKQREANVGRAAKMHQARMAHSMPAIPLQELPQVNVGCSGWFYWHWRGIIYPERMPPSDWFPSYRARFATVELNAPFYSWPTLQTVKTWQRQTQAKPFVYTVKVSELITHVKRFRGTKTLIHDFCYIGDLMGDQMGCFLFQLPPSFDYSPPRLKAIMEQLDHTRRNVLEFRHKTWWNETVYEAFRKTGTIFCSVSAPKLPEVLVKTADEVYLRFHGRSKWYRHDYLDSELQIWKDQVLTSGARRVWAYFNNDREGFAVKNANDFRAMMGVG